MSGGRFDRSSSAMCAWPEESWTDTRFELVTPHARDASRVATRVRRCEPRGDLNSPGPPDSNEDRIDVEIRCVAASAGRLPKTLPDDGVREIAPKTRRERRREPRARLRSPGPPRFERRGKMVGTEIRSPGLWPLGTTTKSGPRQPATLNRNNFADARLFKTIASSLRPQKSSAARFSKS